MNGASSLFKKLKSQASGDGLRAQLVRGGMGSIGLKIASLGLSLGMAVVLARVLGPEQFGVYTYVFALVSLLAVPAKFGLPNLVVRETARAETRQQWGLMRGIWRWGSWFAAGMSLVLAAIGGVCAWVFSEHFTPIQLITFGWGLAFIPLLALGSLRGAALRGLRKVVQGQLPEQVIRPALLIGFVLVFGLFTKSGTTADQAMALHVLAAAIGFAVGAWLLARNKPQTVKAKPKPTYQSKQWMISVLPFAMLGGMQFLNNQIDILMLGFLGSAHEVGLYRVAVRGAALVLLALEAIRIVAAPHFATLHTNGETRRLERLATTVSRITLLLALPITLVFVLFGSELITIVFGVKYVDAYVPLAILAVMRLVGAGFGPIGSLLNMSGYEKETLKHSGLAVFVNVILNVILIPLYGINGAAIATGVAFLLRRIANWNTVRLKLGVDGSAFAIYGHNTVR